MSSTYTALRTIHVSAPWLGTSLGDVVRFMGRREHRGILDLLAAYDVFAFPDMDPRTVRVRALEAAAAGCVPLISRDCGNAEWMIDGVDCLKAERSAGRLR